MSRRNTSHLSYIARFDPETMRLILAVLREAEAVEMAHNGLDDAEHQAGNCEKCRAVLRKHAVRLRKSWNSLAAHVERGKESGWAVHP